ncbi:MAG: ABC transporter substrate-binding protein [Dongiaceae bacterium]
MKRRNGWILATAMAAVAAVAVAKQAWAETRELRMLTWTGYADDDWIKEFEKEQNAKVNVVFAGTDDEFWSKMKGSEGADFDIFAVNTAELQRYIDAGLAAPHDLDKIPNQKETLPRFRDLSQVKGVMRDGKVYAIPWAFDSIGLIYDKKKVSPAPDSMAILWDPKYKGKVLGYDASSHNFSFTALVLGYPDPFKLTPEQMEKVKEKLIDFKRNVLTFYSQPDEALKIFESNDIALIWGNFGHQQLTQFAKAGHDVGFVIPKEGALAWLDTWVLSSKAKDKDLAEAWVNFVLQKKISQALTDRQGFGNTVTELPGANPNDKLIWLLPVEDYTKRSDLWNEIKATP